VADAARGVSSRDPEADSAPDLVDRDSTATGPDQLWVADITYHGCQYTSLAFGKRCEVVGIRPSMSTVGDCYDNVLCESFFATLECELLDRRLFRTRPKRAS